ncbi:MAG: polysaccharide deacetylase family protein [Bacteroidota bacterium]|nr:polysaccharide deacetylase family protein [Bacteroidota bacterium]
MPVKVLNLLIVILIPIVSYAQDPDSTYADRLGFPKGARVLILHVDDAGMSFDSNEGAEMALTKGVSNSVSVMMPCSLVPAFLNFLKKHPEIDAGLHLTLTSEWPGYRWGPVSARNVVGLVDSTGYFWSSVAEVVRYASPDDIEREMKAQLEKARSMGFEPTHLDTHMGTVYGSPEFLTRYLRLGMKYHIPVMLPGGADVLIKDQAKLADATVTELRLLGKQIWYAGLPVLDDLHNFSYGWTIPADIASDDKKLNDFKTEKYIEALKELKPGLTMMIMHCTNTSPEFKFISDSGPTRKGDLMAMMNPKFKKALADQGIILTTWREVKQRRDKIISYFIQ